MEITNITVNLPDTEVEYKGPFNNSLTETVEQIKIQHPSWTSIVIVMLPT